MSPPVRPPPAVLLLEGVVCRASVGRCLSDSAQTPIHQQGFLFLLLECSSSIHASMFSRRTCRTTNRSNRLIQFCVFKHFQTPERRSPTQDRFVMQKCDVVAPPTVRTGNGSSQSEHDHSESQTTVGGLFSSGGLQTKEA